MLKYNINISYQPRESIGQEEINIAGITQSTNVYSDPYYIAYLYDLNLVGNGSTPQSAINDLLSKTDLEVALPNDFESYNMNEFKNVSISYHPRESINQDSNTYTDPYYSSTDHFLNVSAKSDNITKSIEETHKEYKKFEILNNGVTIRYNGNTPGEIGFINGKKYTAVDQEMFDSMNLETDDFTSIVTTMVNNMNLKFAKSDFTRSSFNQPINHFDMINVTSIDYIFYNCDFNQPIDKWNVSNITSMEGAFYISDFNQNINNWDVGNVSNMSIMFSTGNFNQPLNNWNVSNVSNMESMFHSSESFNQPLNNWDVSNVTNMKSMFQDMGYNQPLDNWDVSNVTNMWGLFQSNTDFNQSIDNWNIINVNDLSYTFAGTSKFNQPLNNWDTTNVSLARSTFASSKAFNQPLDNWNVSNITLMDAMFNNANVFNQDLSNWCVEHITSTPHLFNTSANQWALAKPNWGEPCVV